MTTQKRWIDEHSEADDFERAILRSDLDAPPPAGAEHDVLAGVMAVVGPVGPMGPAPVDPVAPLTAGAGALAKGAATLGGLAKGFALGIGVSIAAATGSHFLGGGASATSPAPSSAAAIRAPSAVDPASKATRPVTPNLEPRTDEAFNDPQASSPPRPAGLGPAPISAAQPPAVQAPGASSVASFPSDEAALAASRLKEEAALLRRARAELRAGALAQAFATLEASRRAFTAPELTQEREALAIELLYRSGERAAAASRARDFLARFPESPHAAQVRGFAVDARR